MSLEFGIGIGDTKGLALGTDDPHQSNSIAYRRIVPKGHLGRLYVEGVTRAGRPLGLAWGDWRQGQHESDLAFASSASLL